MKISIYNMEHSTIEFKKNHTVNVSKVPKDGGGLTDHELILSLVETVSTLKDSVLALQDEMKSFKIEVREGFAKQEQFNNFVLDQFKKYGWIK